MRDDEDQACDERYMAWPAMHESALASDNVLVYQIFPAVGNLFITLTGMVQVSNLGVDHAHVLCTSVYYSVNLFIVRGLNCSSGLSRSRPTCNPRQLSSHTPHTLIFSCHVGLADAGGRPRASL